MLSGIPSFLPHFLTISRVQYVSELIQHMAHLRKAVFMIAALTYGRPITMLGYQGLS